MRDPIDDAAYATGRCTDFITCFRHLRAVAANPQPPTTASLPWDESREVPTYLPQVRTGTVEDDGMPGPRKFVEYWRWRYRDPKTGRICRTLFQLSEREAAELPQAERIEGSMLLREVDADDFPEMGPEVHRVTLK
ncbi:MAG TPA: hypothetical protein VLC09_16655 [Polyangiaceae bacterium]|nr:hypothetical protein [Polyangiaceae bacterium]